MALFNDFPYTNFHEINLDWVIKTVKKLESIYGDVAEEIIREILNEYFLQITYSQAAEMINLAATDGSGFDPADNDHDVTSFNVQGDKIHIKDAIARDQIEDLNDRVDDLEAELTDIVFFGDSWTVGSGANSSADRYSSKLATALNLTERNYGVGAAGFIIPGNTIADQITRATSQMSEAERAKVKYVVIVGGINDVRHYGSTDYFSQYAQAVGAAYNAAALSFPRAKIVMAQGTMIATGGTATQHNMITTADRNLVNTVASDRCVVVPSVGMLLAKSRPEFWQDDGLHPTSLGHRMLASYLYAYICAGGMGIHQFCGYMSPTAAVTAMDPVEIWHDAQGVTLRGGRYTLTAEISGLTLIGSIPAICAPEFNQASIITYGNQQTGIVIVTAAGNVYVNPTDSMSGNIVISDMLWSCFGPDNT